MTTIHRPLIAAFLIAAAPAAATAAPTPPPSATAADPAKLTLAHAIINVILPPARREAMFTKLQADMFAQMMPKTAAWMQDPGIKAILDDFIAQAKTKQRAVFMKHIPDQVDAMAQAYARRFTLAELKDINAFAQSPSGQHYLSNSLDIVGDPEVAKVNAEAIAEVRSVTETLLPALKAKVMDYVTSHPDVAAKIKAESEGTGQRS